jgi:cytochrome c oxidase assembly protein subunit 11
MNNSRSRAHVRFSTSNANADAQKSAYAYYARQKPVSLYRRIFPKSRMQILSENRAHAAVSKDQRNVQVAWYAAAVVIGSLGATYAAVPLYKVFCQTTGFGGTTQRVRIGDDNDISAPEGVVERLLKNVAGAVLPTGSSARVHTWTDEDAAARLAELKPLVNADLITVRFDTTVGDVLPWSFVPVQLDVKVVPGETALSFFRVTNHSDQAITGVATYNVHPPKVGMYFQKIQCFCFEEQRLLPGETVDMPVFFFIDPEIADDPQVGYVRSVTLSYTFFQTDVDDDNDDEDEDDDDDCCDEEMKQVAA